jgi:hypothetical protein
MAEPLSGRRGRAWSAVLGSLLGGLLVAGISRFGPMPMDLAVGVPVAAAVLAVTGAVVGNNLRRRR